MMLAFVEGVGQREERNVMKNDFALREDPRGNHVVREEPSSIGDPGELLPHGPPRDVPKRVGVHKLLRVAQALLHNVVERPWVSPRTEGADCAIFAKQQVHDSRDSLRLDLAHRVFRGHVGCAFESRLQDATGYRTAYPLVVNAARRVAVREISLPSDASRCAVQVQTGEEPLPHLVRGPQRPQASLKHHVLLHGRRHLLRDDR
eukprot:scaffold8342_cov248-Pinguiococcus_pyrenoidosus.AAC.2